MDSLTVKPTKILVTGMIQAGTLQDSLPIRNHLSTLAFGLYYYVEGFALF